MNLGESRYPLPEGSPCPPPPVLPASYFVVVLSSRVASKQKRKTASKQMGVEDTEVLFVCVSLAGRLYFFTPPFSLP